MIVSPFWRIKVLIFTLVCFGSTLLSPGELLSAPKPGEKSGIYDSERGSEAILPVASRLFRGGDIRELGQFLSSRSFPGKFKDFENYLRGFTSLEKGDLKRGSYYLGKLYENHKGSFFSRYLSVDLAYRHLMMGDVKGGERFLKGVSVRPEAYYEGSRFLFSRGFLLLEGGNTHEGLSLLVECVSRYPGTDPARRAEGVLLRKFTEKGSKSLKGNRTARLALTLGISLKAEGKVKKAVHLLSLWKGKTAGRLSSELEFALAEALRRSNRYTDAIELLLKPLRGARPGLEAKRKFFAGLYRWYMGDGEGAKGIFTEVVKKFDGTLEGYRSAYNLGRLYEEEGDFNRSQEYYESAAKSPDTRWGREGSFRLGLSLFISGDYSGAEKVFSRNARMFSEEGPHYRNLFFSAYSLEKNGNRREAEKIYESILQSQRGGLYFFQALKKLESFPGWGFFSSFSLDRFTSLDLLKSMEKEAEGRGEKVKIARAREFQELGLLSFSREELKGLEGSKEKGLSPLGRQPGVVRAYAAGDFRKAIRLSTAGEVGRGTLHYVKTPEYFAYPILPFAERGSPSFPDPYFIHAIMRQESAFDEAVVSSAGAVGLGQIMPVTGRRIARGLGVKKYKKEMLFNPIVNYRFSRAYLKSLILVTGGDLVRVAASYNAGRGAVKRWGKGHGSDPFLFPELIGYEETRMYVRRVFLNYLHYLELYGKGWGRHQLIKSGSGKGTL